MSLHPHVPGCQVVYGDFIGMCSEATRGTLAADPDERSGVSPHPSLTHTLALLYCCGSHSMFWKVFACTTNASKKAQNSCRNTFRVICFEGVDGEVMRYGDKIKINTIPMFDQVPPRHFLWVFAAISHLVDHHRCVNRT